MIVTLSWHFVADNAVRINLLAINDAVKSSLIISNVLGPESTSQSCCTKKRGVTFSKEPKKKKKSKKDPIGSENDNSSIGRTKFDGRAHIGN
jgi:hypothetical protein